MQVFDHNHSICALDFAVVGRFQLISDLQQLSECCSRQASPPSVWATVGDYAPDFRLGAMAPDPIGELGTL